MPSLLCIEPDATLLEHTLVSVTGLERASVWDAALVALLNGALPDAHFTLESHTLLYNTRNYVFAVVARAPPASEAYNAVVSCLLETATELRGRAYVGMATPAGLVPVTTSGTPKGSGGMSTRLDHLVSSLLVAACARLNAITPSESWLVQPDATTKVVPSERTPFPPPPPTHSPYAGLATLCIPCDPAMPLQAAHVPFVYAYNAHTSPEGVRGLPADEVLTCVPLDSSRGAAPCTPVPPTKAAQGDVGAVLAEVAAAAAGVQGAGPLLRLLQGELPDFAALRAAECTHCAVAAITWRSLSVGAARFVGAASAPDVWLYGAFDLDVQGTGEDAEASLAAARAVDATAAPPVIAPRVVPTTAYRGKLVLGDSQWSAADGTRVTLAGMVNGPAQRVRTGDPALDGADFDRTVNARATRLLVSPADRRTLPVHGDALLLLLVHNRARSEVILKHATPADYHAASVRFDQLDAPAARATIAERPPLVGEPLSRARMDAIHTNFGTLMAQLDERLRALKTTTTPEAVPAAAVSTAAVAAAAPVETPVVVA